MRKYILYFAVTFFCGCSVKSNETDKEKLAGTWRLHDLNEIATSKKSGDSFLEEANFKDKVREGELLNLFEDGHYTILTGDGMFESGKWKLASNDKHLKLLGSKNLSGGSIKIEKNSAGKHVLSLSNSDANLVTSFIKDAEKLTDFNKDPFYVTNNSWRIKPSAGEDSSQIVARVSNYLKHVALILKAAKDRDQPVVSFEFSKGPIKIYNGGIGIYPYSIIPDEWKNYFYNEEDASKGYSTYEKYLSQHTYRGARTGNWYEDDYNILLSIYSGINSPVSKNK